MKAELGFLKGEQFVSAANVEGGVEGGTEGAGRRAEDNESVDDEVAITVECQDGSERCFVCYTSGE